LERRSVPLATLSQGHARPGDGDRVERCSSGAATPLYCPARVSNSAIRKSHAVDQRAGRAQRRVVARPPQARRRRRTVTAAWWHIRERTAASPCRAAFDIATARRLSQPAPKSIGSSGTGRCCASNVTTDTIRFERSWARWFGCGPQGRDGLVGGDGSPSSAEPGNGCPQTPRTSRSAAPLAGPAVQALPPRLAVPGEPLYAAPAGRRPCQPPHPVQPRPHRRVVSGVGMRAPDVAQLLCRHRLSGSPAPPSR